MTERSGVVTHNQKCNLPGWQGGCCTLISMTTDMSPTGKLSTCRPFAILAQGRVVLDFENPRIQVYMYCLCLAPFAVAGHTAAGGTTKTETRLIRNGNATTEMVATLGGSGTRRAVRVAR